MTQIKKVVASCYLRLSVLIGGQKCANLQQIVATHGFQHLHHIRNLLRLIPIGDQ